LFSDDPLLLLLLLIDQPICLVIVVLHWYTLYCWLVLIVDWCYICCCLLLMTSIDIVVLIDLLIDGVCIVVVVDPRLFPMLMIRCYCCCWSVLLSCYCYCCCWWSYLLLYFVILPLLLLLTHSCYCDDYCVPVIVVDPFDDSYCYLLFVLIVIVWPHVVWLICYLIDIVYCYLVLFIYCCCYWFTGPGIVINGVVDLSPCWQWRYLIGSQALYYWLTNCALYRAIFIVLLL